MLVADLRSDVQPRWGTSLLLSPVRLLWRLSAIGLK